MPTADLVQTMERYHRAVEAFVKGGDPKPWMELFSRGDDATLANPLGPPARGWNQVAEVLERAASQMQQGEHAGFERISAYATTDLAYMLEIEHARVKASGSDEMMPVSLRATTIFRREEGGWRIVHRHADPITAPRSLESILQH